MFLSTRNFKVLKTQMLKIYSKEQQQQKKRKKEEEGRKKNTEDSIPIGKI